MTEQEQAVYDLALTERIMDIRRRNQREERRQWIEEADNRGGVLQVACTYANIGLIGAYITTSGQVCREELGYIEDVEDPDEFDTHPLPRMTWASIKRLQRYLINYQM